MLTAHTYVRRPSSINSRMVEHLIDVSRLNAWCQRDIACFSLIARMTEEKGLHKFTHLIHQFATTVCRDYWTTEKWDTIGNSRHYRFSYNLLHPRARATATAWTEGRRRKSDLRVPTHESFVNRTHMDNYNMWMSSHIAFADTRPPNHLWNSFNKIIWHAILMMEPKRRIQNPPKKRNSILVRLWCGMVVSTTTAHLFR